MIDQLRNILRDNRFNPTTVKGLERKLFYEGEREGPYLVRYVVLLVLSTIIATFGVIQDSTATVIGAMLVAPLMAPIIATTAALVMGQLKRIYTSLMIVLAGIGIVVAVSFVIGIITVTVISPQSNAQIAARISPNLDDLMVALAAGAVGAFAYARDDIADSLPGVAIAIALVPPLSVVGITVSQGNWFASFGAMLLFVTNLLSILLAGGVVFSVLKLGSATVHDAGFTVEAQHKAYRIIALSVLLVSIPLALATYRVTRDSIWQTRATNIVTSWIEDNGSDLTVDKVAVFNNELAILLSGEKVPASVDELEHALYELNDNFADVSLRVNLVDNVPLQLRPAPAD